MSKYLTYDEKLEMEAGLKADLSFGAIGKIISKDRTTVAKEIKRNLIVKKTGYGAYPYNACKLRLKCTRTNVYIHQNLIARTVKSVMMDAPILKKMFVSTNSDHVIRNLSSILTKSAALAVHIRILLIS